jgi:hypothetical protein
MGTVYRRIAPLVAVLAALPMLSLFAGASAGTDTSFGSGVPIPLLAALSGIPEEEMRWGGLAQITLLPGAETPVLVGAGPVLYVIEQGQVNVRSDGAVRVIPAGETRLQEVALYGDRLTLGLGDRVLLAAGVSHAIAATGLHGANLLASSILPASVTDSSDFTNAGIEPVMPFGVALFMAPDGDGPLAWPQGVVIDTHPPVRIVAGSR